jgi:RimJ/RimL family protein N-acetyltransferase
MLRPFAKADFELLRSWVTSPELLFQFSANTFPFPLVYEDIKAYQVANPDRRFFIASDNQNGDYGFGEIIPQHEDIARIGRLLIGLPGLRGQGLGKKMITLLIAECHKSFQASGVQLYVLTDNYQGIRCYLAMGFSYLNTDQQIEHNGIIRTMKKMQLDFLNILQVI